MNRFLGVLAAVLMLAAGAVRAQEAWVQIEARSTLSQAEDRARAWSSAFPDVNGFRLASGWYGIVLGPYDPQEAASRLFALRSERLIPPDSFVADGGNFRQRFWPVGAGAVAPVEPPATVELIQPPSALPDETPTEARRGEATLSEEERKGVQTALQWFGFYDGTIDGAFGRGTRASMAAWQTANGYEATGILTTAQRAALTGAYQEALAALGLGEVVETRAGITITMPIRLVEFDDYAPPFVRYREKDGNGMQVLLISQDGDQTTLAGLYDVMQTLEIVPLEGFRERTRDSFVLTGQGPDLHSYTYARLEGGMVKGFTLVYPPSEEAAMQKAVAIMRDTLRSTGPALDPTIGAAEAAQSRDLLSGLEVRQPDRTRSGVFVDRQGAVLTVAEAVEGCARVTLNDVFDAEVAAIDAGTGLALLRPRSPLAPVRVAALAAVPPRIGSRAAVAGFPFGPALPAATLTFGRVEDLAGLAGEGGVFRIAAATEAGDAGGPVYDETGSLAGILLPEASGDRKLPPDVRFVVKPEAVGAFLAGQGVAGLSAAPAGAQAVEDLTEAALDMTVQVGCWN